LMVLGLRRIGIKLNCEDVRGALPEESSRAAAAASLSRRRCTRLLMRLSNGSFIDLAYAGAQLLEKAL
jgi:hypothetical protein